MPKRNILCSTAIFTILISTILTSGWAADLAPHDEKQSNRPGSKHFAERNGQLVNASGLAPIPGDSEKFRTWEIFIIPDRDLIALPNQVMALSGIHLNDVVADIGCGAGYFTFRFARKVGPGGKVFAVEFELPKDLRQFLSKKISSREDNPFQNIDLIQNHFEDIDLPDTSIDVAFMCLTGTLLAPSGRSLTEQEKSNIESQTLMIQSIYKALRPGGRLVMIDLLHHPLAAYTRDGLPKHLGFFESAYGIGSIVTNFENLGFRFLSDYDIFRNEEHHDRITHFKTLPVYKLLKPLQFNFDSPMFFLVFEKPAAPYPLFSQESKAKATFINQSKKTT
jgi:SAM-dependent methyltransferase